MRNVLDCGVNEYGKPVLLDGKGELLAPTAEPVYLPFPDWVIVCGLAANSRGDLFIAEEVLGAEGN